MLKNYRNILILLVIGLLSLSIFLSNAQENKGENKSLFDKNKTLNVIFYYGQGCPHCKLTEKAFEELGDDSIKITMKEIYFNEKNRDEFTDVMDRYGVPLNHRGVPAILWDNKLLTIGELNKNKIASIANECRVNCSEGIKYSNQISEVETITSEKEQLTLLAVISAALVDSINPCTLAVMAMLLATIVMQKGKKHALWAGVIFTSIVFFMYTMIGLGIIHVVVFSSFEKIFFYAMMVFAFIMAIMEFKAYFDYKPGFTSLEMPMWLRPYAKQYLKAATSPYTVAIAALGCSLFLLPCSSGPYLVILSLLAKTKATTYMLYLILYNLIFVIPMILVTLFVYFGLSTAEKISQFKEKYVRVLHLFSGVLMLILIGIIWVYMG